MKLNKLDLINMVVGTTPSYETIFENEILKECGTLSEADWHWQRFKLEKLTDVELLAVYKTCRSEKEVEPDKGEPYIKTLELKEKWAYNPDYGDDKMCECGHPYYRHFDTYDDMYPCGCKYCGCFTFNPVKDESKKK